MLGRLAGLVTFGGAVCEGGEELVRAVAPWALGGAALGLNLFGHMPVT